MLARWAELVVHRRWKRGHIREPRVDADQVREVLSAMQVVIVAGRLSGADNQRKCILIDVKVDDIELVNVTLHHFQHANEWMRVGIDATFVPPECPGQTANIAPVSLSRLLRTG